MKPVAVVVGFIARYPLAGLSLWDLHYMVGLQQLGYDVHYVERLMGPDECWDPWSDSMSDDATYGLRYLESLLARFGIGRERFSFIDRRDICHGSGWRRLQETLEAADFVLNAGHVTWFDELGLCPRRAFIDCDPFFTQVAMLSDWASSRTLLAHYNVLFTYAMRLGAPDCIVPTADREWIPVHTIVVSDLWSPAPIRHNAPLTALVWWDLGKEISFDGRRYGYKAREFERFVELPTRTRHRFAAAIGGDAPWDRLERNGWERLSPLAKTETIEAYTEFISESYADFGVVKHAYVATRSGWFSDRSTCFLAAGRPVLHQDTGCGDWLTTGEGVLLFSGPEDLAEAIAELDRNYERHTRAARALAEGQFEARRVLTAMLERAGFS